MVDSLPDRCSTCRVVQLSNEPSTSMWLPPWLPEEAGSAWGKLSREARGESINMPRTRPASSVLCRNCNTNGSG